MKKIYGIPEILFVRIELSDVLTASDGLSFNNDQNAEIDPNDVRSFSSFFGI